MSGNKEKDDEKEEDCGCFAESRHKKACPPIRNVTHPLRYYEFTQDEIKALEECDRESFYRRCVPFSAALSSATYMGVRSGYLKRHPHFGAIPLLGVALVIGHILGRLSYSSDCDARLRELPPPSHLGELWRKYHKEHSMDDKKKK